MIELIDRQKLIDEFQKRVCYKVCEIRDCDIPCEEMDVIVSAKTMMKVDDE